MFIFIYYFILIVVVVDPETILGKMNMSWEYTLVDLTRDSGAVG